MWRQNDTPSQSQLLPSIVFTNVFDRVLKMMMMMIIIIIIIIAYIALVSSEPFAALYMMFMRFRKADPHSWNRKGCWEAVS